MKNNYIPLSAHNNWNCRESNTFKLDKDCERKKCSIPSKKYKTGLNKYYYIGRTKNGLTCESRTTIRYSDTEQNEQCCTNNKKWFYI